MTPICGAYVVQKVATVTTDGTHQRRSFGRLRQFRSGRWKASYTGPDGMLYEAPTTFALKQDGEAWLTDRRREIDRDLWSPSSGTRGPPNAPVRRLRREWLKRRTVKGRPLKDRTREHYEKLLDQHIPTRSVTGPFEPSTPTPSASGTPRARSALQ